MILRIVSGRLRAEGLAALQAANGEPQSAVRTLDATPRDRRPEEVPSQPIRALLGVDRPGREVVTITVWSDVADARDALDAVEAGLLQAAVPASSAILGEPAHYDIGSSWLDRGTATPVLFRVAIGRFSRHGSDLEIQELLRERVPQVGPEMVIGCVGRRMVDRAVEVLFFSAWSEEPDGQRLEAPVWADISHRYDEFSVRVYVAPRLVVLQA